MTFDELYRILIFRLIEIFLIILQIVTIRNKFLTLIYYAVIMLRIVTKKGYV